DAYILRLFETGGVPSPNTIIYFPMDIKRATEANLLEEEMGEDITVEGNCLRVGISPWEIKTIKIFV
ncbi:MAG: hypothetical protein KBH15_04800, partial [Candidatus Atribacteria bacterium]|nr:hypothetical protein [Candidatus Atribacteria bacterium]